MLQHVLHSYALSLNNAKRIVNDIADHQMCQQPNGVLNHPAWQLGHLAHTSEVAATLLGLQAILPPEWKTLFSTGSKPTANTANYPSKAQLLKTLEEQHTRVADAVKKADPSVFQKQLPFENFRSVFPTIGDLVGFLLTTHEGLHIGQLTAWRRAAGLGAAPGSF
jgi:hypothetical protein